jgi:hypothetical protein
VAEEDLINPTKPEEIVKEIFGDNSAPLNKFSNSYAAKVLEFAESYSAAYIKYLAIV